MKKLLYTLAFVVLGFTTSYAQKLDKQNGRQQETAEFRAERTVSSLQQKLNLTADQNSKIKQIEIDRIKKNDEWRKIDQVTMKNKMEERKTFMKANKDKLNAVLTNEQKKILADSRSEMRSRIKERKGDKGKRVTRKLNEEKNPTTPKSLN